MAQRLKGSIVRILPGGFGFIRVPGGEEHFVHISSLRERTAWVEGTEVSFVAGVPKKPGEAPPAFDVRAVAP